ncbi:MAG: 6-phosphogluconolactonase [Gammaproteobacteria bacterium]|nr:6-phosphogluconolactonase [Gammaproteobacteria bacterium]MDH5320908.1 6-phosphogluconolactonase [Gammaproteobacteria bacterium]
MTDHIVEHFFDSREVASSAAAQHIVALLRKRLAVQAATSLVVTGGSSPADCYAELAATAIDWSRVHVVLSDERWVPPQHTDSNERLLRETLLRKRAAAAELLPVFNATDTPGERCAALNRIMPGLPLPFSCTLLGMGDDGHFASLFPDAANLAAGLDPNNSAWCIPVTTAASEHLRISMTLSALLRSEQILLLFFGATKRDVYEQAKAAVPIYPVTSLLSRAQVPVHLFWAA